MVRALCLVFPLLLAACTSTVAPASPDAPAGTDALAQVGRWRLAAAMEAGGRPITAALPHGRAVHVLVFGEGRLGIEGGCNHIGGDYRLDRRGRLVVGPIQSTLMACEDHALMAADAVIADLLQGTAAWTIAESYPEQLHLDHTDGRKSRWTAVRPAR